MVHVSVNICVNSSIHLIWPLCDWLVPEPFLAGPDEREVKTRGDNFESFVAKSSTTYQSLPSQKREEIIIERSNDIYSEMFEDADAFTHKESNDGNLSEFEKRPDNNNQVTNGVPPVELPQNQPETTEDWDKEIKDALAYSLVLETFQQRSHNKVYFENQLQNLLYSYPPACQAFTTTANYESAVYSTPAVPPCAVPLACPVTDIDTGQFDDADEDDCMESC